MIEKARPESLEELPSPRFVDRLIKRTLDIALSALFLVLFCWLYVGVWLGVLLTTGAPATYVHQRVGQGGRTFGCRKFRSMVPDADRVLTEYLAASPEAKAEWDATQKLRNDPRITAFGHFIRRTSLDELPQFINVLLGEMSLVGPRPVTQHELDRHYGPVASLYKSVRPGITGLWQVSGRSLLAYSDRVAMDAQYVRTRSTGLDLKILAKTVVVVLGAKGSH